MREMLSDTDWDRIQEFAASPSYDRDPDILLPEEEESAVADAEE